MNKKKRTLSSKTMHMTIKRCIVFGLVVQLMALTFYAFALVSQYINSANTTLMQLRHSVTGSADIDAYSGQVMEIYQSLTDEQRQTVGSDEYRELFSSVDTTTTGGDYDTLIKLLAEAYEYHTQNDVADIYIAMYDEKTSAMVYIVDPGEPPNRLMPGDWESVNTEGMMRFLNTTEENKQVLYDIGYTENYGFLCTVGVPIWKDGEIVSFVFADISMKNIKTGMIGFALSLTAAIVILTAIIAWFQTSTIKRDITAPINMIADASKSFASDEHRGQGSKGYFSQLDIHTGDEIEHLVKTMSKMESELYDYGENLLKVTKEKERIGTELSLARKIQADMLPRTFPPFPNRDDIDIFASMTPAKEVGGDFYDFFLIDDDHLGMVMADVSGKGVPAALFMMASKILIKNFAMQKYSPAKVLELANMVICQSNDEDMFVSVWFGILEISSGKIIAANAGHEFPIIKKPGGGFELFKDKHDFVIGGLEGLTFREYELSLEKGGVLFLYTDGVPEATDPNNELYGTDRLIAAMNKYTGLDTKDLITSIKSEVDSFVGAAEPFDDITMLGVRLK